MQIFSCPCGLIESSLAPAGAQSPFPSTSALSLAKTAARKKQREDKSQGQNESVTCHHKSIALSHIISGESGFSSDKSCPPPSPSITFGKSATVSASYSERNLSPALSPSPSQRRQRAKSKEKAQSQGQREAVIGRRQGSCALSCLLSQEALQPPSASPPPFPPIRFNETARPRQSPTANLLPPPNHPGRASPSAGDKSDFCATGRINIEKKVPAREEAAHKKSSPPTLFCVSELLGSQRNCVHCTSLPFDSLL